MTLSAATSTVQTLLAFDFGQKRIGVAVGNSLTGAARPLVTLTEQTTDGRFARIQTLLKEWQPYDLFLSVERLPVDQIGRLLLRCSPYFVGFA